MQDGPANKGEAQKLNPWTNGHVKSNRPPCHLKSKKEKKLTVFFMQCVHGRPLSLITEASS